MAELVTAAGGSGGAVAAEDLALAVVSSNNPYIKVLVAGTVPLATLADGRTLRLYALSPAAAPGGGPGPPPHPSPVGPGDWCDFVDGAGRTRHGTVSKVHGGDGPSGGGGEAWGAECVDQNGNVHECMLSEVSGGGVAVVLEGNWLRWAGACRVCL